MWSRRFFKPSDCIRRISSQRSARASGSAGTKGAGFTFRVSSVSVMLKSKSMSQYKFDSLSLPG